MEATSAERNNRLKNFLSYRHLFFFLIIGVQLLIYNYPYILQIEPRNHHAFRQYDCLSFAQSYYNNRATLTQPCVNNLGVTGDGKTASDFPIIQYLVGNIWKLTGVNTSIYRLFNVTLLIIALFFVYKLFLAEFKKKVFATLIVALIFTSPILSYYGVSVLSDIQALSLSLVGFYFYYTWIKEDRFKFFMAFSLFFLLAGLLKISSAMLFVLCLSHYIFQSIFKEKTDRNKGGRFKEVLFLVLPIFSWMLWYMYAKNYNLKNNSCFFLIGILPIWEADNNQIIQNATALIHNVIPSFISPYVLFSLVLIILTSVVFYRKENKETVYLLALCLLLFIMYILLYFKALNVHDYYLLNLLGVLTAALFFSSKLLYRGLQVYYKQTLFLLGFLVLLNSYTSSIKTWKKVNFNVQNVQNAFAFNQNEKKEYFWMYWLDREKYKILENGTISADRLGITRSDTIMCVGDGTPNRSLYLLNRLGYTDFNRPFEDPLYFLNRHPSIRYLLCIEPKQLKNVSMNFKALKIFEKGNLSVYKIK